MRRKNTFMLEAIKEALLAKEKGEIPVGCVIVHNNQIIARSHNLRESSQVSLYHAEILAIKEACEKLNSWRLTNCDLYVTLEPCPMCAGAIVNSRIRRLYFGAFDEKAGAAGSVVDIFKIKELNHKVEVYMGIEEEECTALLSEFFTGLRESKEKNN